MIAFLIGDRYRLDQSPHQVNPPRSLSIDDRQIHNNHPPGHVPFSSYSFISLEVPASLDQGALAFLASRGCLSLPKREVVDEFITQYFLHVHPWAPIIDEAQIWDLYQSNETIQDTSKFPLLVFQALLFISTPHVSVKTLQTCGFADQRTACNTLYNRTKVQTNQINISVIF